MTQLWPTSGAEGFETGDLSHLGGSAGTVTVISSDAHAGTYCASVGSGSGRSYAYHVDGAAIPASGIYSAECWMRITNTPATGDLLFDLAGGFDSVQIRWNGTNWQIHYLTQDLSVFVDGGTFGTGVLDYGAGSAWHRVTLTYSTAAGDLSGAQRARIRCYVDGVLQTTDYDTSTGAVSSAAKPNQVYLQANGAAIVHYDDVRTGDSDLGATGVSAALTGTLTGVCYVRPTLVQALPLISKGVPAYTGSVDAYPVSYASANNFGQMWRSVDTAPVWLAYNLSGVPAGQRGNIVLAWYNTFTGIFYNNVAQTDSSFSAEPRDYTVQGSSNSTTGADGTWTTLATVTGSLLHSHDHALSFSGYTWIKINVTNVNGAVSNQDVCLLLNVHDASLGHQDSLLILGDSITQDGTLQGKPGGGAWPRGNLPTLLGRGTGRLDGPVFHDGGVFGQTMAWAVTNQVALLGGFSGPFVGLAYGTNDANLPNPAAAGDISTYYTNLLNMIDYLASQSRTVIVPTIPWAKGQGYLDANAALFNTKLQQCFIDRPNTLRGPDFYAFFQAHPNLIRSDNLHPTLFSSDATSNGGPATYRGLVGYEWYQLLWQNAIAQVVYGNATPLGWPGLLTTGGVSGEGIV